MRRALRRGLLQPLGLDLLQASGLCGRLCWFSLLSVS